MFGDAADETPAVIPGSLWDEPLIDPAAMIDQHMVTKRLESLDDQFSDSELGNELVDFTQNLVAEAGSKTSPAVSPPEPRVLDCPENVNDPVW